MTYSEKLKLAEWQEFKASILHRRGATCEVCCRGKGDNVSVHVHHKYYDREKDPWEYPPEAVIVLCSQCHRLTEESLTQCRKLFGQFTYAQINSFVREFNRAVSSGGFNPETVLTYLRLYLTQPEYVKAVIDDVEFHKKHTEASALCQIE